MHIRELRILNYKRFRDSGSITLGSGFNVLVGENDVGKSALVQFLDDATPKPHRSSLTQRTRGQPVEGASRVVVTVDFTGAEIETIVRHGTAFAFNIAAPLHGAALPWLRSAIASGVRLHGTLLPGRALQTVNLALLSDDSGLAPSGSDHAFVVKNRAAPYGLDLAEGGIRAGSSWESLDFNSIVAQELLDRLYAFRAERFNVGKSNSGTAAALASNAANLPEVLYNLQGNPARMDRFRRAVHVVFPHVQSITVRPLDASRVQVLVWHEEVHTERDDLAVPLNEGGTGLSQVLAMLYVVLTAEQPQIVVIDEPHSFLHPGALRRLFHLFASEFSQHQYIITTNSPVAILEIAPASIYLLQRDRLVSVQIGRVGGWLF